MTSTVRVLVIDDELAIHDYVRAALSKRGPFLLHAWSAAEGIRMAESQHPDVVLLDLDLPDCEGPGLLKSLRAATASVIVALSNRWGEADRMAAITSGADAYLPKPFLSFELQEQVEKGIGRQIACV